MHFQHHHVVLQSALALMLLSAPAFSQADAAAESGSLSLADIYSQSSTSAQSTGIKGLQLCMDGRIGQGVQMIRQAAEAGDTASLRNLGICTIKGIGTEADAAQGLRLLEKAAEAGDTRALQSLCRAYLLLKDHRDSQKACDYARKAAATDQGASLIYAAGLLARDEPELAFSCAEAAAGMDNGGEGKRILANLYFMGLGCEKSIEKTEQLFREAADQGNTLAQSGLLEILSQHNAYDDLYAVASKYALTQGGESSKLAMYVLARLYLNGSGNVEQNIDKAFFWVKRGAEEGHMPSQALLWKMLWEKKEYAHMYKWAREAALQGEPGSQAMLARALYFGLGCDADSEEAILWIRKAQQSDMTPVLNDLLNELRLRREWGDAKATAFLAQLEQRSRIYGF